MQALDDPEKPMICPYDKNHTIFAGRFAFHLTRCRKNHTGAPIAICDYNHDHRIPKPELQYHLETCPDRFKNEARSRDIIDNDNVMEFPIKNLADPVNEKWDDEELNHPGYNYEEHIENKNVVRSIAVEKPSVKKQFRRDEQRRMNILRAQNPDDDLHQNEASGIKKLTTSLKGFHLDEDKPDLSLNHRINNDKTMYQVVDSDGFQLPKKNVRKNKNK